MPLKKNIGNIAVIGPNADMMYNQLGDYTAPQEREEIVTVLDGIRKAVSPSTKVNYVKGCAIRDVTTSNIPAAVEAAVLPMRLFWLLVVRVPAISRQNI